MDSRFTTDDWQQDEPEAGGSGLSPGMNSLSDFHEDSRSGLDSVDEQVRERSDEKIVQPLSAEALAEFEAAQNRAGIVYISRIPPGMQPPKVRHLMSEYGEVGRIYLQQEDPKRAHLRRKYTTTKKAHYTEGWVEFKSKKVARSVAEMLNAQPIGGKKGTRWRDDVWTLKYLPRFKWNMLTEHIAQEAAEHAARLRAELSQSKSEQQDYLRKVELARVLDKRAERKRKRAEETGDSGGRSAVVVERPIPPPRAREGDQENRKKKRKAVPITSSNSATELNNVLGSIF